MTKAILELNATIDRLNISIQRFNNRKVCALRPDIAEQLRDEAISRRSHLLTKVEDPDPSYKVIREQVTRRYNR